MRLHQVALPVSDLARATAFYSSLLDAQPIATYDPPGLVFFDLDGVRLMLQREETSALIYLAVPSVAETIERIRDTTEIVSEPHVIFHHEDDALGPAGTDEWQAIIRDSEGNLVGLVSQLPTSPVSD